MAAGLYAMIAFIWEEEIRTAFKRQPPILLKCDLNYFWKIFTGIYRKFLSDNQDLRMGVLVLI